MLEPVEFPCPEAFPDLAGDPLVWSPIGLQLSEQRRVLVVDNEASIRDVLRQTLEFDGYLVSEAVNGQAALDALALMSSPAVVLLDLEMPVLDGIGVLSAVERKPALACHAFIMVTAYYDFLSAQDRALLASQHVPVVQKPFNLQDILICVAQATRRITPS